MAVPRPPIDDRTYEDLVRQTEALATRFTDGEWRPGREQEFGSALIRIMAGMAEQVVTRLNELPDRAFLAFLDLIGTQIRPPQPAQAALTFLAAAGAVDAVEVPAGSQVAAPAEGDRPEVVFETDRRLVVTPAQVEAIFVRDPGADRYSEHVVGTLEAPGPSFPAFVGAMPIPHRMYVACDSLLGLGELEAVHVSVTTMGAPDLGQLAALPVRWSWWDGEAWNEIPEGQVAATRQPDGAAYSIIPPPPSEPVSVAGLERRWLRGSLAAPMPPDAYGRPDAISRRGLKPQRILAPGGAEIDQSQPFFPFGPGEELFSFKIMDTEVFGRAGAEAELEIELDRAGAASADVELEWAYPVGSSWRVLGTSTSEGAPGGVDAPTVSDGTMALTQSGSVRFTVPYELAESGLVRLRVSRGNYGLGESLAAPLIRWLSLGYHDWEIPAVDSVTVEVESTTAKRLPDGAYANQVELDITKDFLPFGEQPTFNDTLYVNAHEFGRTGSRITLAVNLSSAGSGGSPTLTWEVATANGWQVVQAADGTRALTTDGTVTFVVPGDAAPATVNGVAGSWLRVRLTGGDYGEPGRVKTGTKTIDNQQVPTYEWIEDTFTPPTVSRVTVASTYTRSASSRPAEACITHNDFREAMPIRNGSVVDGGFAPFIPTSDTRPCLYLGFDRPLGNRPVSLFADVEPALFDDTDLGVAGGPSDRMKVDWEYAGADGAWHSLGAADETRAFSRRGPVSFVGPADAVSARQLGSDRWWIRARWERGRGAVMPVLRRILPNTVWATEGTSIDAEVLGTGTGNPDQQFTTSQRPVLDGEIVEIFEPGAPVAVGDTADVTGGTWVTWKPVPDFYGSAPGDRHYVIDRIAGRLTFGDGRRGMVPPIGTAGNVRVSYRTGGGVAGNVPPGAINELRSAIASVDAVANVEAAAGGAPAESFQQLRERGPSVIRHRSRAVTAQDYEDLAKEASPDVVRAVAVLARSGPESGRVGVVVVPGGHERRPVPSLELLGRIEHHLRAHCDPTVGLWVAGPRWRAVAVTAEVAPVSPDEADEVRAAVLAALYRHVHPLYGGRDGRGFPFDRLPHDSEFYGIIESVPGVDHVRRLSVVRQADEKGSGDAARRPFLVYSGDHQVAIIAAGEGG